MKKTTSIPMDKVDALARLVEQAYRSGDVTESTDYFSNIVCDALGVSSEQMAEAIHRKTTDSSTSPCG